MGSRSNSSQCETSGGIAGGVTFVFNVVKSVNGIQNLKSSWYLPQFLSQ